MPTNGEDRQWADGHNGMGLVEDKAMNCVPEDSHLRKDGDNGTSVGMASTETRKTTSPRTVVEVLMKKGARIAPPVRRKAKAKRGCTPTTLGNIRNYFSTVQTRKEWKLDCEEEGGNDDGMRKRKLQCLLEDPELRSDSNSRRLKMMEPNQTDVEIDSRTLSPSILGAKSECGREPGQGLVVGGSTGLDLMVKNEEMDGNSRGNLTRLRPKSYK